MAKSILLKEGSENYTISPYGVTAKISTHKSLNKLVANLDTLFIGSVGGTGIEQYYFLGVLGKNDSGDDAYINIKGTAGGWTNNSLATFDVTYSSRGNSCSGVWYGYVAAWDWFDFKIYKGSDNLHRIYLHRKSKTYAGEVVLTLMSRSDLRTSDTPESMPSGTLVYTIDNNNLTKIG